jgi:filamentous hemagglutinin
VYNFEVADNHNYYVRGLQVLVHNDCKLSGKGKGNPNAKLNKQKGDAFEAEVKEQLELDGHTNILTQVTLKTKSGTKTKVDFISEKDGKLVITEAKSSEKAPLTKNQESGFPEIETDGATVVGKKGEKRLPEGTKIAPTKVNIVRKKG